MGNSFIEILIADLHCQGSCIPSLIQAIRQAGRYCSQIRSAEGDDKKIVLLLVFQYGYREQDRVSRGKIEREMLKGIMKEGVEV